MNKHKTLTIFSVFIFAIFSSFSAISQIGVVTVTGEVEKPLTLDSVTMQKMTHADVVATGHSDNKTHVYKGIPLFEIIKESGAIPNNQLRGKYLAKYVLIKAADGYQAIIALPEIDTAFTDRVIILADKEDGKPLGANAGPYQIIVPGDKKHARYVRQVTAIVVLSAKEN